MRTHHVRMPTLDYDDPALVRQVETLAGYGLTGDQIAAVFGVHRRTLERHMLDAIQRGRATAIGEVAKTAYKMAVEGNPPAMTMFYLKCQGRWKERHDDEPAKDDVEKVQLYLPDNGRGVKSNANPDE